MATDSLGVLSEEQRHAVQVSQKAARKLESLIEDLLTFPGHRTARSVSGRRRWTYAGPRIGRSAMLLQERARPESTSAWCCGRGPLVQGDREKILWALTHLLENAIKFTGSGGRVELGLKPESTNLVMVSVRDTGIGIAPQHLQEIFEPFRQLDASARRRAGGTGLGLTLVRQIVEAHGSILDVSSVEGKGTVFKFPLLAAGWFVRPKRATARVKSVGALVSRPGSIPDLIAVNEAST